LLKQEKKNRGHFKLFKVSKNAGNGQKERKFATRESLSHKKKIRGPGSRSKGLPFSFESIRARLRSGRRETHW